MSVSEQGRIGRPPMCGGCGECVRCKHAAYMRQWNATKPIEHRRAIRGKRKERRGWADRPPEARARERVRLQTRRAIAKGTLVKENCARCNSPFVQAHHEDYSTPLAVTWLCPFHHSQRHQERQREQAIAF